MNLYKIENHPDLVKDMDSKAILNTNYAGLLEYRKKQELEKDVNNLKSDVKDIKEMLSTLLSMVNKQINYRVKMDNSMMRILEKQENQVNG